jgi:hypothetical protein
MKSNNLLDATDAWRVSVSLSYLTTTQNNFQSTLKTFPINGRIRTTLGLQNKTSSIEERYFQESQELKRTQAYSPAAIWWPLLSELSHVRLGTALVDSHALGQECCQLLQCSLLHLLASVYEVQIEDFTTVLHSSAQIGGCRGARNH